ncbi:MAG: HD domain-containing protein [Anaerolineae bacterium]
MTASKVACGRAKGLLARDHRPVVRCTSYWRLLEREGTAMEPDLVTSLARGLVITGRLSVDVPLFLRGHGCAGTAEHSALVAAESRRLAPIAGCDAGAAEAAGWLHDISAVFPASTRLDAARQLGIVVLSEESAAPMILHQKLSAVLARELFGVTDRDILDAIACHTTLRAGSTSLDRVVFVADKIAWDGVGEPPYLAALLSGLAHSVDHGALAYLRFLWERRDTLPVAHPAMVAAYTELSSDLEISDTSQLDR